jgi:hypothetical protein
MKPFKTLRNVKPICFVNDWIIMNKSSSFIVLDAHSEEIIKKIKIPIPYIKRLLFIFKPTRRLFRLGAINGIFSMNKVFITIDKKIFSLTIDDFKLREEHIFKKGNGPLYLKNIERVRNFKDGLYFGDYFGNNSKEPINITRRNHDGTFEIVYTFPKGQINHIHNLILDNFNDCVWILAGDFGEAAGIWQAKDNFKSVKKVLTGSQQYRSCIAFPTKDGLIYPTDSQFEQNYIRILKYENDTYVSKPIQKINGSVIYGCSIGEKIIFSTSTEPSISNNNKFLHWLERKPGSGINKNESHLVLGTLKDGFKIIDIKKKDLLPYRLFQFGTIMFPSGINPTNKLFSYSVANIKNDLHTEIRVLQ